MRFGDGYSTRNNNLDQYFSSDAAGLAHPWLSIN
jgi:hypothetical protein